MGQQCSHSNSKSKYQQKYRYDINDFDELEKELDDFLVEVYQQNHHSKTQSSQHTDRQEDDLRVVNRDENQKYACHSQAAPSLFLVREDRAKQESAYAQMPEQDQQQDQQQGSEIVKAIQYQQQDQSSCQIEEAELEFTIYMDHQPEQPQQQVQEPHERVREQQKLVEPWVEQWVERQQRNFYLKNFQKVQQLQQFYDKFFERKEDEQDEIVADDEKEHPQPNFSSLKMQLNDRAQNLGKRDLDRDWEQPIDMVFICAGCQNTIAEQIQFLECGHTYHTCCIIGMLKIQIDQESRKIITDSCQHKIRLTSLTCLLEQEPQLLEILLQRQIDCLKLHMAQ